jgi:hypothetical protein
MPRPKPFVALHGAVDFDRLGGAGVVAGDDVFVCRQSAQGGNVEVTATQMALFFGGGGVPDPLELAAGSEAAPAYTFIGQTDDGMFSPAPGQVALTVAGVEAMRVEENGAGVVQLIVPSQNDPLLPSLAFGTGVSGFFESAPNVIRVAINAVSEFEFNSAEFKGVASNAPSLRNTAAAFNGPNIHARSSDTNTGIGSGGLDDLSVVCGSIPAKIWEEVSSQILETIKIRTGVTASTTQAQGQGLLTSSWNEIATVANTNDVVTMPVITTTVGKHVLIINNGANTLQVFPNTGQDLGAGVNVSITIATGLQRQYQSIASLVWQRIIL